jgi:uncharacterized protein YjhX (UPF0386 family)
VPPCNKVIDIIIYRNKFICDGLKLLSSVQPVHICLLFRHYRVFKSFVISLRRVQGAKCLSRDEKTSTGCKMCVKGWKDEYRVQNVCQGMKRRIQRAKCVSRDEKASTGCKMCVKGWKDEYRVQNVCQRMKKIHSLRVVHLR